MTDELAEALREVTSEIVPRFGSAHTPEQAKVHLIDRWYRFTAFGVTGRDDLKKLTCRRDDGDVVDVAWTGDVRGVSHTINVMGTVLEGK